MKQIIKEKLREGLDKPNCDCCKYFDMKSLNDYVEIEKPLYSIVAKRRIGVLEYIKPKQYIYKIAHGFGVSYEDALGGGYDENLAKSYAERMKSGEQAPIGYYTYDDGGQEGRHRAMAAMFIGCELIPIVKIKHLNNSEFLEYVNKFKGKTFEELNNEFINNGYPNGITKLGFNDLTRYIEYNL